MNLETFPKTTAILHRLKTSTQNNGDDIWLISYELYDMSQNRKFKFRNPGWKFNL